MTLPWTKATDAQILTAYAETDSVWKAAKKLGMCGQSVHERLVKLGAAKPMNVFTEEDKDRLRAEYQAAADAGKLTDLAADLGRTKHFICRQARSLGLTKQDRQRRYLAPSVSLRMKAFFKENEHPRGALGMRHSPEAKERMSAAGIARWAALSEDERAAFTMKQMKAKIAAHGSLAGKNPRGSWKAAWREIGGKRKFYRSRWEANYARYLQWLLDRGEIAGWEHEPETFWFEAIKRGVRSYLPDFRVTETSGASALHEVKGWMCSRSRTTLKRMAKYHPQERVILIGRKEYHAIERKVSGLVPGWEAK